MSLRSALRGGGRFRQPAQASRRIERRRAPQSTRPEIHHALDAEVGGQALAADAGAVRCAKTTFLDGMSTYVMKLGADNLPPPYDSPIDRRMAASPHLTLLRLRTQQVARLIADALVAELAGARDGAAAFDQYRRRPGDRQHEHAADPASPRTAICCGGRSSIHVLDSDEAGPSFGKQRVGRADGRGRAARRARHRLSITAATIGTSRRRSKR